MSDSTDLLLHDDHTIESRLFGVCERLAVLAAAAETLDPAGALERGIAAMIHEIGFAVSMTIQQLPSDVRRMELPSGGFDIVPAMFAEGDER